jgi:hypothetical protein
MTTQITISIQADEAGKYTARELAILSAISGNAPAEAAEAATAPAPVAVKPVAPKPAATKPAAAKPTPKPAPVEEEEETVVTDDEAEEETAGEEDDVLGGGDDEATTFTKKDAVARATQLVSEQKQALVKKGLASVGAKRVSDLNDSADIQSFMAVVGA